MNLIASRYKLLQIIVLMLLAQKSFKEEWTENILISFTQTDTIKTGAIKILIQNKV